LDAALTQAAELFEGQPGAESSPAREVVVVSDFQEGARVAGLQGYTWPAALQVRPEKVAARSVNNAGLQLLAESSEGAPGTRVRVYNAPGSQREQFQVGWAGAGGRFIAPPLNVYVIPGQSRVVNVPAPAEANATRIVLTGDEDSFDNQVWAIPPEPHLATLVYWGEESAEDARKPFFFLERALPDTPRQRFRILRTSLAAGSDDQLKPALWIVTRGVEASQVTALQNAAAEGATVLLMPLTASAAASQRLVISPELAEPIERTLDNYAMLVDINFSHPLFAPFSDARFSDFTKLHFWRYRQFDFSRMTNAQVLARFDTGDPALVSVPHGRGRFMLLTSGWQPSDSQLALSSKFVPLIYSFIELGSRQAPAALHTIGQPLVSIPAQTSLKGPDGQPAGQVGESGFIPRLPGIYSWTAEGKPVRVAVNLDGTESRTAPLPADELERLGVPGPAPVSAAAAVPPPARLKNGELEARQKLWRWMIAAALGIVLMETWLAGWTARRSLVEGQTA
jgi:hypothetical protein